MSRRFVRSLLHPVCLIGLTLFLIGFLLSCHGLLFDLTSPEPRPYQGLLTFVLFPFVTVAGLAFLLFGLLLERRRARRLQEANEPWIPRLDLSRRSHRLLLVGLGFLAAVFAASSVIGSYRAYHFTESETFCGALCHTPMQPQYVAHRDSPHANIACTECHVGPHIGDWIDAKMAGLHQLRQVLTGSFVGPIRADRTRVPAASETCLHCHSTQHFAGKRFSIRQHFGYDLRNTRRHFELVLDVGGSGDGSDQLGAGVHWHASADVDVFFRAVDDLQQDIPWVRVVRQDGSETTYWQRPRMAAPVPGMTPPAAPTRDEIARIPPVRMDCIDCHNRPTHRFDTPEAAVDRALENDRIDASLPSIKKVLVQNLQRLADGGATFDQLQQEVTAWYEERFVDVLPARRQSLEQAIATARRIYERNNFPGMRVDGHTYPDNIGHRSWPGCLRCHDGRHVSDDGKVLSGDCKSCHELYERSRDGGSLTRLADDLASVHPFSHPAHRDRVDCWSCHTGNDTPYAACTSCHERHMDGPMGAHAMTFECSICHVPGEPRPTSERCAACHPLGGSPLHLTVGHENCATCHQAHVWTVQPRTACVPCHATDTLAPHDESWRPQFDGVEKLMMGLPIRAR